MALPGLSLCSSLPACPPPASRPQLKSYSCSLTGEGLAGLLEPGSLLVQCNTGLGSNAAPAADNATAPAGGARRLLQAGSGAFCEIGFK